MSSYTLFLFPAPNNRLSLGTFNSKELQDIVSRAIRSSARESFIRLVSIRELDQALPAEIERLNALKAMKQAQYRFKVQRRTMLLQALISFALSGGDKEADGGIALISNLTAQLSGIVGECDLITEELVSIGDQLAQLTKLLDVHWASALAIALRKVSRAFFEDVRVLTCL